MEHALLNDESESGQELGIWQEGSSGWGGGWGYLEGQGGDVGGFPEEGRPVYPVGRRRGEAQLRGLTRPPRPASALQGFSRRSKARWRETEGESLSSLPGRAPRARRAVGMRGLVRSPADSDSPDFAHQELWRLAFSARGRGVQPQQRGR